MPRDALTRFGLDVDAPAVDAECIRIARRLRDARHRVLGLIPATDRDAVPPAALRIGRALVQLTGATVAYVDANVHWPAMADAACDATARAATEGGVYATRWLSDSLALLAPPHVEQAGAVVPQLERVLADSNQLFEHVLVDLTGLDRLGEHAAAAALMDGVIVVARAGHSKETILLAHQQDLRDLPFYGVLLVG